VLNLDQAIKERRSIRKFKKRPVEKKIIEEIIESGKYAPSACNMQMWHFLVVNDDKIKNKLCEKAQLPPIIKNSPFTIFVLYNKHITKEHHSNIQSSAAAIQNMLLKAYSLGIGSVWLTLFLRKKIRKILKIPDSFFLVAAVCFGYPDEKPTCPIRRDNVASYNFFGGIGEYPASYDPEDWSMKQIKNYHSFKIRAMSPSSVEHRPEVKPIYKKIAEEIGPIKGKLLDIFPFLSNHTLMLLREKKIEHLFIYEMSDEIINFIRWKFGPTNKKINYIKGLNILPIKNGTLDVVTCFEVLEKMPNPEKIISEIHRVLKKSGTIYLFFRNKTSLFSMYFYYKVFRGTHSGGPFKPISYNRVMKTLEGFEIKNIFGINLLSKTTLEDFKTKGFLKRFCRDILIEAVKK